MDTLCTTHDLGLEIVSLPLVRASRVKGDRLVDDELMHTTTQTSHITFTFGYQLVLRCYLIFTCLVYCSKWGFTVQLCNQ